MSRSLAIREQGIDGLCILGSLQVARVTGSDRPKAPGVRAGALVHQLPGAGPMGGKPVTWLPLPHQYRPRVQ